MVHVLVSDDGRGLFEDEGWHIVRKK